MRALVAGVVLCVGAGTLHLALASETGGYDAHYTDHLRHMGSARALVAHGFDVYRQPYAQATQRLLPCPAHAGLFDERTAPYPPLGLLLHWPLAELEVRQVLAPATAHRLQTLLSLLGGLLAFAAALTLLRARTGADTVGLVAVVLPLLVGVGANGFYDAWTLAAGLWALHWLRAERPVLAVALLVVAASLSFRALVFAPTGFAAVVATRRRHAAAPVVVAVVALFALIPTLAAASTVAPSLEQIPAHNPLYGLHLLHGKPRPLLFAAMALGGATLLFRARAWLPATTLLSAWVVVLLDRSYGYWHALPLVVPWLVMGAEASLRAPRVRWAALAGLAAMLGLGYLNPLEPSWGWLRRHPAPHDQPPSTAALEASQSALAVAWPGETLALRKECVPTRGHLSARVWTSEGAVACDTRSHELRLLQSCRE
jgi:hypothetical protein